MGQLSQLLAFLLVVPSVLSACTNPSERRAWHTLSNDEKLEYINAELCLMAKPANLGLPGARTRFDDLQAIHQRQAYATHFVGAFLPFHRLLMHAHEEALRNECSYTGHQPYWSEERDSGHFSTSILLDPEHGFGGDGSPPNGCITTGPFANYTNSLGPGYQNTRHCINRQVSDAASTGTSRPHVAACQAMMAFIQAWPCFEGQPHVGGHAGVGGEMFDGVASPGDPLFYLHHTWLDKVFWEWQAGDREVRTRTVDGPNVGPVAALAFPPRPSDIPQPTGAPGDPGIITTMGHVLNMYGNGPNRTIADVMDIQGGILCYEYVEPEA